MLLAALPILIELFTSEGCSSCPPADAVLSRIHERQPVPGVELVVMSEHVDYWNSPRWRDPFSAADFTERQRAYAGRVARDRVYTPQAVVDGRLDVLGSDQTGVERAAQGAASEPHGTLTLTPGAMLRLTVAGLPRHGPAELLLAVVEDELVSHVAGGENEGRTLVHTAVVRSLRRVATVQADAAEARFEVDAPRLGARQRLVAFLQDSSSLRVLAAASAK